MYIDIKNISFRYHGYQDWILKDFTCHVNKGEILAIVGPSGGGKSTILRLISGLEAPDHGEIIINERVVVDQHTFTPPERRRVGMMFQDYALFPHLNVVQNIQFGLHKQSKNQKNQRTKEVLELVNLNGLEKRFPYELSGGQQQRVALARMLAPKPEVILMDEPFSSLDGHLKQSVRNELREIIKREEMTCVFVTHDKEDVKELCDRVVSV